jgi:hypothetical protein
MSDVAVEAASIPENRYDLSPDDLFPPRKPLGSGALGVLIDIEELPRYRMKLL